MGSSNTWWYEFKEGVARSVVRIFMPRVASAMNREVNAGEFENNPAGSSVPEYLLVEDRGAPVTVFCFSSAALLFAGQPTFEFRSFFRRAGDEFNLVFFRDVHRSCYHIAPDGKANGLEFYESEVRRLKEELGAEHNIAIGDSSGAAASFHFALCCGFDKIIGFSPPFPLRTWISPGSQLRAYFDLPLLLKNRGAYWEHAFLSWTPVVLWLRMIAAVGPGNVWNPVIAYRDAEDRPKATVLFGEGCRQDGWVAHLLDDVPEAKLVPLPTSLHYCMAALAKRGELGPTILREIEDITGPAEPAATE